MPNETQISIGERFWTEARRVLWPLYKAASEAPDNPELQRLIEATGLPFTSNDVDTLYQAISAFPATFDALFKPANDPSFDSIQDVIEILEDLKDAFAVVDDIRAAFAGTQLAGVGPKLLGYLSIRYIAIYQKPVVAGLLATGLVDPGPILSTERPSYQGWRSYIERVGTNPESELKFGDLTSFLRNPRQYVKQEMNGETSARAVVRAWERALSHGIGRITQSVLPIGKITFGARRPPALVGFADTPAPAVTLTMSSEKLAYAAGGVEIGPVFHQGDPGLFVYPWGNSSLEEIGSDWQGKFALSGGGAGLILTKDGLYSSEPTFSARVEGTPAPGADVTTIALGPREGTRLEISVRKLLLEVSAEPDGLDVNASVDFRSEIVANPSESDGFIQELLAGQGTNGQADVGIGWSSQRGLFFRGGAALQIDIPVHGTNGKPLSIQKLVFGLRIPGQGTGIPIDLETDFTAKLGPVTSTVEGLGLTADLTFPTDQSGQLSHDGNLGVMNATIGFNPPEGVGLDIDAGPTSGGGYLFFDTDAQEYGGAVELNFQTFGLAAVGLITTKMPDGSSGFSMMVIISAEFQGVQLGFGFVLTGVGGLLGINRQADTQALRSNMKNGGLSSIMFPEDVVENAQRIVSDVGKSFPVAEGNHVFGPILRIGWGTPAIFELTLGVVVSIPSPTKVLLLGRFELGLPALVDTGDVPSPIWIKVDFLGSIDPANGLLSLDGILYDSRLTLYSLEGQFAMQQSFGDDPLFLISIGGFHPDFEPPPKVPSLNRLSVSIGEMDNPVMRAELYLAVTSNTLQLGAKVEASLEIGDKFSVGGWASFDALIIFSPLSVDIAFKLRAHVTANGKKIVSITVDLNLQGPKPWRVKGRAKIKVLFIKLKVRFSLTFGRSAPPPIPETDVLTELMDALGRTKNWAAKLPEADREPAVLFRKLDNSEEMLHPDSSLTVRQKVVPFDLDIERYSGAIPVADGQRVKRFEFDSVSLNQDTYASNTAAVETEKEKFAPGTYLKLSDDEKLSRPSFESYAAGGTLAETRAYSLPEEFVAGTYTTSYEQSVVDTSTGFAFDFQPLDSNGDPIPPGNVPSEFTEALAEIGDDDGTTSSVYEPQALDIRVDDPGYSVVSRDNATTMPGGPDDTTFHSADRALDESGNSRDDYHVVLSHEEKAA